MKIRTTIKFLVFASFLVLAAPIHAGDTDGTDGTDDKDESSTEEIEAPSDEATSPVDAHPPAGPSDPVEDDEGKSD